LSVEGISEIPLMAQDLKVNGLPENPQEFSLRIAGS